MIRLSSPQLFLFQTLHWSRSVVSALTFPRAFPASCVFIRNFFAFTIPIAPKTSYAALLTVSADAFQVVEWLFIKDMVQWRPCAFTTSFPGPCHTQPPKRGERSWERSWHAHSVRLLINQPARSRQLKRVPYVINLFESVSRSVQHIHFAHPEITRENRMS